ncbi:hypothetical protein Y032_0374g209 [Ancylostoma ceylanicum]|uniref:C2H2-type domain-containing protein n=1 Tax=Ancylostoma ceylanicum TaxID=53326 RepID=A0A016RUH6_9BILA|nr:hypothetical protein Y032_0374g209 [Ancylostoma ceylanicum]
MKTNRLHRQRCPSPSSIPVDDGDRQSLATGDRQSLATAIIGAALLEEYSGSRSHVTRSHVLSHYLRWIACRCRISCTRAFGCERLLRQHRCEACHTPYKMRDMGAVRWLYWRTLLGDSFFNVHLELFESHEIPIL